MWGLTVVVRDEVQDSFWGHPIWAEFWRIPRVATVGLLLDCQGVDTRSKVALESEAGILDQDSYGCSIGSATDGVTGRDVALAVDFFGTFKVQRDFDQAVEFSNFLNSDTGFTAFRDGVELLREGIGAVGEVFHVALLALEEDDIERVAKAVQLVIDKVAEPSWTVVHHLARLLADCEVGNLAVSSGELTFKSRRDSNSGGHDCG